MSCALFRVARSVCRRDSAIRERSGNSSFAARMASASAESAQDFIESSRVASFSGEMLGRPSGERSAIWRSPDFRYNGAGGQFPAELTFDMDRRADVDALLDDLRIAQPRDLFDDRPQQDIARIAIGPSFARCKV